MEPTNESYHYGLDRLRVESGFHLGTGEENKYMYHSLFLSTVNKTDDLRMHIVTPDRRYIYLKASSVVERQKWLLAIARSKQSDPPLESGAFVCTLKYKLINYSRTKVQYMYMYVCWLCI